MHHYTVQLIVCEIPRALMRGAGGAEAPQNVGRGVRGARATIQRANLGLAVTAKLPQRAKYASCFGHSNAENLSSSGGFAPAPNPHYRLALRARHESPHTGP